MMAPQRMEVVSARKPSRPESPSTVASPPRTSSQAPTLPTPGKRLEIPQELCLSWQKAAQGVKGHEAGQPDTGCEGQWPQDPLVPQGPTEGLPGTEHWAGLRDFAVHGTESLPLVQAWSLEGSKQAAPRSGTTWQSQESFLRRPRLHAAWAGKAPATSWPQAGRGAGRVSVTRDHPGVAGSCVAVL